MSAQPQPKVSVVILNYNGLEYLQEVLPEVLSLEYPNVEVIVVDNGSTDKSVAYLSTYPVKVISNPINSYAAGKNLGADAANGEYVLLLDNDIKIEDKLILTKLVNAYTTDTAFIQVPLVDVGKTNTQYYGLYPAIYGTKAHSPAVDIQAILNFPETLVQILGATGGCMFFRKEIWRILGDLDESQPFNIDDIDIGPRAYLFGYKNFLYTKSYFRHLGIKNAEKQTKVSLSYIERFKYLFSGHARSMVKNYKLTTIMIRLPALFTFLCLKTIKQSFEKAEPLLILALIKSIVIFGIKLPDTLKQRRYIQSKRLLPNDNYLQLLPAQYEPS